MGEAAGSTESSLDGKVQVALRPDPNSPPEEAVETRTSAGADDVPADTKRLQSSAGMIAAVIVTVAVLAAIIGAVVLRKGPQMLQDETVAAGGGAAAAATITTANPACTHFAPRAAGKGGNTSSGGQLQANSSYDEGLCLVPTPQQGGGPQSGPYLEPVGYNGSVSGGAYSEVDGIVAMCSDTMPDYAEVGGGGGGDRGAYLVPTPLSATGDALYDTAADGSAGVESGAYYATVANGGASSKQQADPHHYEYADAAAMALAVAGAGAGASPTYAIATDDALSTATYDVASNDVGGVMYTYDVAFSNDDVGAAATYDVALSNDNGYLAVGDGHGSDASKMREVEGLYDTNVGSDSDFC